MDGITAAKDELIRILEARGRVTGQEWYRLLLVSGGDQAALFAAGSSWRESRGLPRDGWIVPSLYPVE